MSKRSISFDDEYIWGLAANNYSNRPYAEITLHGPSGSVKIWTIVDSGADQLQLNENFARQVGLLPSVSAQPRAIRTASGASVNMSYLSSVDVDIEGKRATVDGLFGIGVPDLLGRTAFLKAISFGMDSTAWLYRV